MNIQDIASKLFGSTRIEESGDLSNRVDSITAAGATASEAGAVGVTLDAEITPADDSSETDETIIEMPTSPSVDVGDDVIIGLTGEGPLKVPVVLANPGSGDRVASQAQQAIDIAEATGQHFWDDDSGAHVTELARPDWETQQTGPNSLWNSLGMLFRDGLNNLLAIVTGATPGLQIFDGQGNAAENILAEFTSTLVRIGGKLAETGRSTAAVQFFEDASAETAIEAEHYIASGEAVTHGLTIRSRTDDSATDVPAGRWAQGSIGTFEQVYSDSSGWSVQASSGIHAQDNVTGSDFLTADVQAEIQRIGSNKFSRVHMNADSVRLQIASTGVIRDYGMQHVIDMLSTEEQQLTRQSGAASWSGGQARRCGKIVVVTVNGMKLASALASGKTSPNVGTIPAGLRPNVLQRVPAALNSTGNFGNVWVAIGASGNIQIRNASPTAIPTTNEISFSCSYVID